MEQVGNPEFAIIDEAFPYLSKRLLTDDAPRLRAALRYMVYGKGNTFDVDRLIELLQVLVVPRPVFAPRARAPCRAALPDLCLQLALCVCPSAPSSSPQSAKGPEGLGVYRVGVCVGAWAGERRAARGQRRVGDAVRQR